MRAQHILPTIGAFFLLCCSSLPVGSEGPAAESLAAKMLAGAAYEKWQNNTAAVSFNYREREDIFWDKKRGLAEVTFKKNRIQFRTDNYQSLCFSEEKPVDGEACSELTATAIKKFVNDTYWLNPAFHIKSPGAKWKTVEDTKLMVQYESGGVTPGDAYIFTLDDEGKIINMQTWASTIFIKGTHIPFSGYITTETGVPIATNHTVLKVVSVDLAHVKMYAVYPPAGTPDRFADLWRRK